MIFFPAIDLKDGKCVRLKQGDILKSTIFDSDPVARAESFHDAGCSWLHLVDLNGAFEGKPINHKIVEKIIKSVDIKIQLGGGVRNFDTIDFWMNAGIKRLIIGTMALKKPACDIDGMVIGGHGDTTMIPLTRLASYNGIPINNFLSEKILDKVSASTMVGGATLTKLLGTSAWYAPGASVSYLVDSHVLVGLYINLYLLIYLALLLIYPAWEGA